METAEMIYKASYAIGKKLGFEELKYSDEMYGHEDLTEEVWEYVNECVQIGVVAFKEKYKGVPMYWGVLLGGMG